MRRRTYPVRVYMEDYERIQDVRGEHDLCDSARAIEIEFARIKPLEDQVQYLTITLAKAERERNQWKRKYQDVVKSNTR